MMVLVVSSPKRAWRDPGLRGGDRGLTKWPVRRLGPAALVGEGGSRRLCSYLNSKPEDPKYPNVGHIWSLY